MRETCDANDTPAEEASRTPSLASTSSAAAAALERPSLRDVAIAAVAQQLPADTAHEPVLAVVRERAQAFRETPIADALAASLRRPAREDARLVSIGASLRLADAEILAVALAVAIEESTELGRALAYLQAPLGGTRPTLGLLATALADLAAGSHAALDTIAVGNAVQSGLLTILGGHAPLPERPVAVPLPICLALRGHPSVMPGVSVDAVDPDRVPLPPSTVQQARRHAAALASSPQRALVLRTGSPAEGRAVAEAIAAEIERSAAFVDGEQVQGLVPWLLLRNRLPVFALDIGPGERRSLPALPLYDGPVLAIAGPDGSVGTATGTAMSWSLPVPPAEERRALWEVALGDRAVAATLARDHRHGAGRIAHLGKLAHHRGAIEGRTRPIGADVTAASWVGEGAGLDGLAQPLTATIPEEALVVPPVLRAELDLLVERCRARDRLAEGLGPSALVRYTPGVRALFVGPSGTGKTLAAGWVATRLGLPLFRVDLASLTSKYIGETEKNLAQLLARAEHAEVVLLFDEADSVFGKRTDVKESNDRFANSQTNYLLQRIETFEGITILTSNSQSRFDPAFTRRIDVVLEFMSPSAEERRGLWRSHLGGAHDVSVRQIDQLAALADIEGGQIRNVVLTAAVLARGAGRPIQHEDILRGLASEYKKLGRQAPHQLRPDR